MNTIYEDPANRYALVPVEAPADKSEAHNLEHRMRGLGKSGHRHVYKGKELVGDIVDHATWPYEHQVTLSDGGVQKSAVTLPAQTAYVGLVLNEEAWADHKAGRLPLSALRIGKAPVTKAHNDPYHGKKDSQQPLVNPDDGAPLGQYGLPVRGDEHTDPAVTGNVAVDLTSPLAIPKLAQRYGPGLERMKPHEAASMALHPMTHPMVRQVLRRRANTGRR